MFVLVLSLLATEIHSKTLLTVFSDRLSQLEISEITEKIGELSEESNFNRMEYWYGSDLQTKFKELNSSLAMILDFTGEY